MSEPQTPIWLKDGPFAQPQSNCDLVRFIDPRGVLRIPVDERFEITAGDPFAHAIY